LYKMTEINTTEYLAQLLKDKKQLAAFPNVFLHLERILDEGNFYEYLFIQSMRANSIKKLSFKFHIKNLFSNCH